MGSDPATLPTLQQRIESLKVGATAAELHSKGVVLIDSVFDALDTDGDQTLSLASCHCHRSSLSVFLVLPLGLGCYIVT